MIAVHYPEPQFRTKVEGGKRFIFDGIRKTWLVLTEEEWVRQNFVNYLVAVMHYPAAAIAIEKEIRLGELKKRFDVLVYDGAHHPWMLVECKRPSQPLSEAVLQQALRYHLSVPVQFVVITNGDNTVAWKKEGAALQLLQVLPVFGD